MSEPKPITKPTKTLSWQEFYPKTDNANKLMDRVWYCMKMYPAIDFKCLVIAPIGLSMQPVTFPTDDSRWFSFRVSCWLLRSNGQEDVLCICAWPKHFRVGQEEAIWSVGEGEWCASWMVCWRSVGRELWAWIYWWSDYQSKINILGKYRHIVLDVCVCKRGVVLYLCVCIVC